MERQTNAGVCSLLGEISTRWCFDPRVTSKVGGEPRDCDSR